MKKLLSAPLLAVGLTALLVNSSSADIDNDPNFQGMSGLINVPTGETLRYGEFNFTYNNLVDSLGGRFGPRDTQYFDGNDINFLFSPFPGVEVGMRNIGNDFDSGSDLSANFKYSPTFIPDEWFDLAIGMQDIGGEANNLGASYVAVSKRWRDLRVTAGIGQQQEDNAFRRQAQARRFEGGFFGVEYQPFEWLALMGEHDGANNSAGIKLKTPMRWLDNRGQFFASFVVQEDFEDSANEDNFYFNVGFRGSLFTSDDVGLQGRRLKERQLADSLDWLFSDSAWEDYEPVEIGLSSYEHQDDAYLSQLGVIKREITRQGFERVWLGLDGSRLYIRFENSVFNRNDLDAIGVVLGIVVQMLPEGVGELDVTMSKYDVPTFRFTSNVDEVKAFYEGESRRFSVLPAEATGQEVGDMLWLGGSKSPYWVPRISFSPLWRNFVGTEIGVLDYSLALRTNLTVPLWRGAELIADYDVNLDNSENFEPGRSFFRFQHEDGLKNFLLRQTVKLPYNVYASLAVGRVQEVLFDESDAVVAEAAWQSPTGAHRVAAYGSYQDSRVFNDFQREIYIGRYRYYSQALDMSLAVEAGQFWREDRGVRVSALFNFGDTRVEVFARDTDVQSIGIGISVPLTLRRDMRPGYFQLKGDDSWTYRLATRVNADDNRLVPLRAYRPEYLGHLESTYFNDDRLTIAYLRANQARLRAAFIELVR